MNYFSMLKEWITNSIHKRDFIAASLQIDQLLDIMPDQTNEEKEFWTQYIMQYLIVIYSELTDAKSIAGQAGNSNYQEEIIYRVQSLKRQKLALKKNSVDHCFVYVADEIVSNKNEFLNTILPVAKEKEFLPVNLFYFMQRRISKEVGTSRYEEVELVKSSLICIPVKSSTHDFYEHNSIEYYITATYSYIENELIYKDKNFLFAFEFISDFSNKEKEKFYRSLIRIMIMCFIKNWSLELKNFNIYFDSENDADIFNNELDKITNLISYYSLKNTDVHWRKYLSQHPYIKEGRIHPAYLKVDKIVNPIKNKIKNKAHLEMISIPDTLQGKVKTNSRIYNNLLASLNEVVKLDLSLLLLGDTGVGKGELAKQIHNTSGRKGEYRPLNCSAFPPELIDSELFGSVKGAFTGAVNREGKIKAAEGGTLFLDEIGKAPLSVQYKLLTFIQDKEYYVVGTSKPKTADVRLIFASNENLNQLVSDGKMLEEFYYRIAEPSFIIPSIRERVEDIESFVNYFITIYQIKFSWSLKVSESALKKMKSLKWPGNIRQIENIIKRIFVYCKPRKIEEVTEKELDLIGWNESAPTKTSTFEEYESSYKSLFQIYLDRINEIESINLNRIKDETKKYGSNNSHSFLKLVVEPIAASHFKTLNLGAKNATKYLGLDGNNGLNSLLEQRAKLYPKIDKFFRR